MTRVYLHIGIPKTGTTAIQHFLSINQENLLNQGFLYPLSGTRLNSFQESKFASHVQLPSSIKNELSLSNSNSLEKKNKKTPGARNGINCLMKLILSQKKM